MADKALVGILEILVEILAQQEVIIATITSEDIGVITDTQFHEMVVKNRENNPKIKALRDLISQS